VEFPRRLNLVTFDCVVVIVLAAEQEEGMKRTVVVLIVVALALLGPVPAAWAQTQPSQGESSTGRNDAGFGGGPHCHLLVVDSEQTSFDIIQVFPSHTAHVHSGLSDGVFAADADCDGM
jgi:hypothetical protein